MKTTPKRHSARINATYRQRKLQPQPALRADSPASPSGENAGIDLDTVEAHLSALRALVGPLRVLTVQDRVRLFKMNGKRAALGQNSQNAADNPLVQAVVPRSFDLEAFSAKAARTLQLAQAHTLIKQLFTDVDDTLLAERSEVVTGAAKLYTYVKAGAKDNPGLKPVAEQLGEGFKKTASKPAPPAVEKK